MRRTVAVERTLRSVVTRGTATARSSHEVTPKFRYVVSWLTEASIALVVVTTSSRPVPATGLSCVNTAGTSSSPTPSSLSNVNRWKWTPRLSLWRPTVSARSARIGPKLLVDRVNRPSPGSRVYVKPEAGVGMGRPVSWLAMATLNCVNSAWNALLKCAEWVCPLGRRASLSTTSPVGP